MHLDETLLQWSMRRKASNNQPENSSDQDTIGLFILSHETFGFDAILEERLLKKSKSVVIKIIKPDDLNSDICSQLDWAFIYCDYSTPYTKKYLNRLITKLHRVGIYVVTLLVNHQGIINGNRKSYGDMVYLYNPNGTFFQDMSFALGYASTSQEAFTNLICDIGIMCFRPYNSIIQVDKVSLEKFSRKWHLAALFASSGLIPSTEEVTDITRSITDTLSASDNIINRILLNIIGDCDMKLHTINEICSELENAADEDVSVLYGADLDKLAPKNHLNLTALVNMGAHKMLPH